MKAGKVFLAALILAAFPALGFGARENSSRDDNGHRAILLHDATTLEVRRWLDDGAGGALVSFGAGASLLANQGISGVSDADPWNMMIRNGSGTEVGLAASPFAISIYDAASNLLGVTANPLVVDLGVNNDVTLPPVLVSDSNNTTTTPLGIGATFTGTATDLLANGNPHVVVTVFADQVSAADGLVLQFSQDGTNWRTGSTKHTFTLVASEERTFQFGPEAQFFRVVLTNGGVGQGTLSIETMLGRVPGHKTLHRVGDTVTADRSVELAKSILFAQKPDLSFANVDMTAGGNLKFSLEEIDGTVDLATETTLALMNAKFVTGTDIGDVTINNAAGASGVFTQGGAADGAAVAGNPALMAGRNTSGFVKSVMVSGGGILGSMDRVTGADGLLNTRLGQFISGSNGSELAMVAPTYFNGTTWDLVRGDLTDGLVVNLGTNNDVVLAAGSASIGTLGANSGVDIGDVDVTSQPARVSTTDTIGAVHYSNSVLDGTTLATPKFAVIDDALSGDNTIVAAVASKKIRVLSLFLVANGDVDARFESGAAGTALTGQMDLTTNSGFSLPYSPVGHFETAVNTLLNLELSGAVSVDGSLVYIEVD